MCLYYYYKSHVWHEHHCVSHRGIKGKLTEHEEKRGEDREEKKMRHEDKHG